MTIAISILIIMSTFLFMEFVAWATHKYVMHGFLWHLHKDHHVVNKDHKFQKNDWVSKKQNSFCTRDYRRKRISSGTYYGPYCGVGVWISVSKNFSQKLKNYQKWTKKIEK